MSKSAPKPRIALTVSGGRCNVGMPNNVFDRFVWAVRLYAQAGFKVVIDNHGGWRGAARVCIGRGGRRGESIRQGGVGAGGGGSGWGGWKVQWGECIRKSKGRVVRMVDGAGFEVVIDNHGGWPGATGGCAGVCLLVGWHGKACSVRVFGGEVAGGSGSLLRCRTCMSCHCGACHMVGLLIMIADPACCFLLPCSLLLLLLQFGWRTQQVCMRTCLCVCVFGGRG